MLQVTSVSNGLSRVEERFKTSPELINVPHDMQTLTSNVASFGSQMKDLVSTVAQLKDANTHLTETAHVLDLNITTLKVIGVYKSFKWNDYFNKEWRKIGNNNHDL